MTESTKNKLRYAKRSRDKNNTKLVRFTNLLPEAKQKYIKEISKK